VVSPRRRAPSVLGLAATLAAVALPACTSAELAPPVVRMRTGPAAARPMRRVVALPSSCGSLTQVAIETADPAQSRWETRAACPANTMTAIDNAIRAHLEFRGFHIIDGDKVNAVTGTRREVSERRGFFQTTTTTTETAGARFADATPFEQRDILRELGADGVLTTRISIGAGLGFGQRRTIIVQLRLLAAADGALVWARRCELEVAGLAATDELAMEAGARCAIEEARAR
jgi:hypothetical protein